MNTQGKRNRTEQTHVALRPGGRQHEDGIHVETAGAEIPRSRRLEISCWLPMPKEGTSNLFPICPSESRELELAGSSDCGIK
uniref:Uncharacterized protein n=1 Tax=Knipowitschia caucasica TaxID=637954 RepID=A0AAV2JNW8_KNICA